MPILGIAFVGDANEDSEATIAPIGKVRRLGRLPRLDPLTPGDARRRLRRRIPARGFRRMTSPVWHPFTQHGLGEPIPLVARAEGAALYDRRRPPHRRRDLVLVGDDPRPSPSAHHGRDRRPGRQARPDHLRRLDPRAGRNAGARAGRDHARAARPCLLLGQRIDQRRGRAQDGARLLGQHAASRAIASW